MAVLHTLDPFPFKATAPATRTPVGRPAEVMAAFPDVRLVIDAKG